MIQHLSKEYLEAVNERKKDKKKERIVRPKHELYSTMDKDTSKQHKN